MKFNLLVISFLILLPGVAGADFADIGVATKPLDANQADTLGILDDSGFIVTEVFNDTPGAALGLVRKDIITTLNEKPVFSVTDFARLVAATCAPNDEVTVGWLRDGEKMSGQTTLDKTATKEELQERYENRGVQVGSFGIKVDSLTSDIMTLGRNSSGISFSAVYSVKNEHGSVTAKPADNGKKHVVIKDNDDNIVFDDTISPAEVDRVPEQYRETTSQVLDGNMFQIRLGGSGLTPDIPKPEKDIDGLLEDADKDTGTNPEPKSE
jgi:membrane-associated protease RseP (regulator of RpoE activity)